VTRGVVWFVILMRFLCCANVAHSRSPTKWLTPALRRSPTQLRIKATHQRVRCKRLLAGLVMRWQRNHPGSLLLERCREFFTF
jgi:hypothetical protein